MAVNTQRLRREEAACSFDLETAVFSRLSSSASLAPYPEPEASPHDSVRRRDFRVSRAPHRAAAILPSVDRPSPVLLVPRAPARNDHLRVRGRDRTISRQRAVVHPLQHRECADLFGILERTIGIETVRRRGQRYDFCSDRSRGISSRSDV